MTTIFDQGPSNVEEDDKFVCSDSPMHIILVADDSGSMAGKPADLVNTAIRKWLNELLWMSKEGTRDYFFFTLITFGTHAKVYGRMHGQADSDDRIPLPEVAIDSLQPITGQSGGTNIGAALRKAIDVLRRHRPKPTDCYPFVYLYTDGKADDPEQALRAAEELRRMELPCGKPRLVVLGFHEADRGFLEKLAGNAEYYFHCDNSATLAALLPDIGSIHATHSLREADTLLREKKV